MNDVEIEENKKLDDVYSISNTHQTIPKNEEDNFDDLNSKESNNVFTVENSPEKIKNNEKNDCKINSNETELEINSRIDSELTFTTTTNFIPQISQDLTLGKRKKKCFQFCIPSCIKSQLNPYKASEYSSKFNVIFSDFKEKKWFHQYYMIFDYLRYAIACILIVSFHGKPFHQSLANETLNFFVFCYIICSRPFKSKRSAFIAIFNEIMMNAAGICVAILAYLDFKKIMRQRFRLNLGWAIILANILLILMLVFNFIFTIWDFVVTILKKLLNICKAYKKSTYEERLKNKQKI